MMNKRALLQKIKEFLNSDKAGRILGGSAGAAIGGLGGALLAGALTDNKALRILGAVVGASAGGYGGYRVGSYMDTQKAGLISENEGLTDKYNVSQDKLTQTSQQLAQSQGQLTDVQNKYKTLYDENENNKGEIAYLNSALKSMRQIYDRMDKQHSESALNVAKYIQGNKAAANKLRRQQTVIDLLRKHIPASLWQQIYDYSQAPQLLPYL